MVNRHLPTGESSATPFPSRQLIILALCRICEPIAFMSIFPYAYYMILSFDITTNTQKLALYVGLVTSAFAFAEFSSGVVWGRISDRVGRKPVLLCGLAGTALSMLVFGFATNLPVALLGRALGGLLNGNMGVLQTTVAEIVTVKEHQPRAYSIMPFVWCLGSILGPMLGGALAQPCLHYPTYFQRDSIFDTYPFLLPNVVCAIILVCGVVIGFLFMEETHSELKARRDVGVEAGNSILNHLHSRLTPMVTYPPSHIDLKELGSCDDDDAPPGYRTTDGTPRQSLSQTHSTGAAAKELSEKICGRRPDASSAQRAFTKQVIVNIIAFGILAYHSISFDQLMPVFLSEPVTVAPVSLPFQFTGGFGLSTKAIGFMLSVQGVYSMVAQLFIFPLAAKRFGPLKTFRVVVMVWPLLYLAVPYVVLLPQPLQKPGIYACLLLKITFQVLAFPSNAIRLTNSAPSTMVLGLINGVAASTASLARTFGPSVTGLVHSWGLRVGCTGVAWWVSGLICAIGALETFWMEDVTGGRMDERPETPEDETWTAEPLLESYDKAVDNIHPDCYRLDSKLDRINVEYRPADRP